MYADTLVFNTPAGEQVRYMCPHAPFKLPELEQTPNAEHRVLMSYLALSPKPQNQKPRTGNPVSPKTQTHEPLKPPSPKTPKYVTRTQRGTTAKKFSILEMAEIAHANRSVQFKHPSSTHVQAYLAKKLPYHFSCFSFRV